MSEKLNGLVAINLFSPYGEIHDDFLIGGLVQTRQTFFANAIYHCRQLINFRFAQNNQLYLAKVLDGFKNHEIVKIWNFDIDILFNNFKQMESSSLYSRILGESHW